MTIDNRVSAEFQACQTRSCKAVRAHPGTSPAAGLFAVVSMSDEPYLGDFMVSFETMTACEGGLTAVGLDTLQVNLGLRCNQQCAHCHVEAGPRRTESMRWDVMTSVLEAVRSGAIPTVDLTGGAPELNPNVRDLVKALRRDGRRVILRTNLTVMLQEAMSSLPAFLRRHRVELVASMPCYTRANVDAQRGDGTFDQSIRVLRNLNALGYGSEVPLDLVYNPGGAFLPGRQDELEADYRRELGHRYDVRFTSLRALTNMPIGRFRRSLGSGRTAAAYLATLRSSFNGATVPGLMCRRQVSVGWDGTLYDCDFNLALRLAVGRGAPRHIRDFDAVALATRRIATGEHCFGCTAGAGSSCGGALAV